MHIAQVISIAKCLHNHFSRVYLGVASFGSLNSYNALMGKYEGEGIVVGLEHEHVLPSGSQ